MASEEQAPSLSHISEAPPKKKKKKRKKKGKTKRSVSRIPRRNNKSYGFHNRRESIPHHATVQSLASINAPIIVNKLSKMSQDLKYQRDLQKALMELNQKGEDYRYAIEIGESLTKENAFLKEQIDILESQLHHQETDNTILREKLETLHATYSQDLSSYHQDLQAHKQLVSELQTALQSKHEELKQQKAQARNDRQHNLEDTAMLQFERMTSDEISNLSSNDMQSPLEKQLLKQLEKEKKNHAQSRETVESLMRKLDDMHSLKRKYDSLKSSNKELKRSNKELKQITKDELAQHIAMQKSIEQEAIYLASRKANLEEERDELVGELEQRDYEITMLHQQLALQRKEFESTGGMEPQISASVGSTLGDIINEDQYYEYHDPHDPHGDEVSEDEDDNDLDHQDEIDIIAEILDDENIFVSDEDDTDVDTQNEGQNDKPPAATQKISEESRDKKAFDKIKEYLHLTASAVKIKYPTVKNIQSDELIKSVKDLPFYKYHDQMVRIMETQIKKVRDAERKNQPQETMGVNRPKLEKRKSFLSIFNVFGRDELEAVSDDEDDGKSEGGRSSGDEDAGITNRRRRGKSRKKKSKKKSRKAHKSLPSPDGTGMPASDFQGVRGVSVQAAQKRLK
eukprot:250687_1